MDMYVSRLDGQSVVSGTNEPAKRPAAVPKDADHGGGGDTVSISQRGMRLAGSADTGPARRPEAAGEVNVKDLRQELQKTNKEVASVKDEIETLKQQAGTDPMKKTELGKKKSKLHDLEEKASDLKADVYA